MRTCNRLRRYGDPLHEPKRFEPFHHLLREETVRSLAARLDYRPNYRRRAA